MSNQQYEVEKPHVSYSMYWPEILLIVLSILTPLLSWVIWRDRDILQRSGIMMVFLSAVAEFISIHRMNKKHILNACRVKANELPWDFSRAAKIVGIVAFFCALVGIFLSGFGNFF
jgi:hypothetical protein